VYGYTLHNINFPLSLKGKINPMKKLNILFLAAVLFSSCKKDDVAATPPDEVTVNPDGTLNPQNADGALYAIESRFFDTRNGSTYDADQTAYAWFGSYPAIIDAGIVKVNNIEMDNLFNSYTASGTLSFGDTLFKGNNANAVWNVQGKSASGVAAFTHTDNTTLPIGPSFTLPATVNINNSLTVNHTTTGGAIGVLYTLIGDLGQTTKHVANTSNSITFTSAEIKKVAVSGSQIGLSIMPVTYTTASYGGKKYYFVKQHQYARETATL
jgi:hypothetical protein